MALNDLNDYQERAARYDITALTRGKLWYYGLGIAGEAGEVADKIKKLYREGKVYENHDGDDVFLRLDAEERAALVKELGDVLWYLAAVARLLDVSLSDVAHANLKKLYDRLQRGVMFGSGDER